MNLESGAAVSALPPHHQPFVQTYRQKGYWSEKPVPDFVADAARARADTVAVVDRKGGVSYRELAEVVRRLAAGLWMLGARPGDAVAIQLPNWREFVFFQQAAVRIGAIYIPLLPQLRAGDLEYLLSACRAKMLVVPGTFRNFDHVAMAMELRARLPGLLQVFVVDPVAPLSNGCASVEEFLSQPWESEAGAAVDDCAVSPDAVRTVLFTSGTESRPKGVLHSYNTLFFGLHRHVDYFGFKSDDAVLTASPVGHGTGAVNGSEFGLLIGGKVVLLDTWNAAAATELIARERCSFMWGAATFFTDLIEVPERSQYDLSSFRLALTAGAPISPGLVAAVCEKLGARLVSWSTNCTCVLPAARPGSSPTVVRTFVLVTSIPHTLRGLSIVRASFTVATWLQWIRPGTSESLAGARTSSFAAARTSVPRKLRICFSSIR